jgi:hypothetical protein
VIALQKAGRDLTLEKFIAAVEGIKDYQDIFGSPKQTFGPNKHLGNDQVFMAQVKNGRWVRATGNLSQ